MNISELVAILQDMQAKHGDLPVQCTWETIFRQIGSIYRDDVSVMRWVDEGGRREYRLIEQTALVIDADGAWPDDDVPEEHIGYKIAEGA
jgi:hypothetical protein